MGTQHQSNNNRQGDRGLDSLTRSVMARINQSAEREQLIQGRRRVLQWIAGSWR